MKKAVLLAVVLVVMMALCLPAYGRGPEVDGCIFLMEDSKGNCFYLAEKVLDVGGENNELVMLVHCRINQKLGEAACLRSIFDIDNFLFTTVGGVKYPDNQWIDIPAKDRVVMHIEKNTPGWYIVMLMRDIRGRSADTIKKPKVVL